MTSSSSISCNSSYSQKYYVILQSVVDYEDEYQEDLQGDSQEDKLTTTMMLLARAITQKFSTPTNNHLRTLSNTRNQAMIQDGELTYKPRMQVMVTTVIRMQGDKVWIKRRNEVMNVVSNQILFTAVPCNDSLRRKANVQCYNCNEKGHYARDCQKPRVRDAKYFKEKMLLAIKDEAGSNLNNEENDFMLDTSNGEETMEELTAEIMLMAQIQPADGNAETMPSYKAKDGLGYKNTKRLKKVIAAQPKMYDGEKLHSVNLKIDSPDSEKTLEDAKESRLKMRHKMVQINYGKLNALYETFGPQQDFSME
ncbi:retrovirus-related pol polyprotein from transposon TNT 1-94 [Tanacetum coccineum]